MGQCPASHVVKLHGMVTVGEPVSGIHYVLLHIMQSFMGTAMYRIGAGVSNCPFVTVAQINVCYRHNHQLALK